MPARLRALALAAGIAAVLAPPASAAGWLPAQTLTPSSVTSVSWPSNVSDAAGDAFSTWVASDGTTNRVWLSSHAPGALWTTPVPLSDAGHDAGVPVTAMSADGHGAVVWTRSDGTNVRIEVSLRAPNGQFGLPTVISNPGSDVSTPAVAVDDAGDVEVAWSDATRAVHARRYVQSVGTWSPVFDLSPAVGTPANQFVLDVVAVMSPAGVATVAWTIDTDPSSATSTLNVFSRTSDGDTTLWLPMVTHTTTAGTVVSSSPQLAVAGDGTVTLVWMEYQLSCHTVVFLPICSFTTSVVKSQTRSAAGVWSGTQTLSDPSLIADNPAVATSPAGETTVVWTEAALDAIKALTRTVGGGFPVASAATIITPQDRTIVSGNFFGLPETSVHVAEGAYGTVVTFERSDGTDEIASAVMRPPGGLWPNPTLVPPAALSAPGASASFDGMIPAVDAAGDITTSWERSGALQVSTYDASVPAVTAATVPSTGVAGQPVAMSATAFDAWGPLAAGQPSWSFGDGGTAAGANVVHSFPAPGIYTVTIGAIDAAGNVAAPSTHAITISSPPVPPLPATTVETPKQALTWKAGKLGGSVTISGTVAGPATLTITVTGVASGKVVAKASFTTPQGAWSKGLALPATLLPGSYVVGVTGPAVLSSTTSFTIAAPATGIVSRSYASATRGGPAAASVGTTTQLWAHYRFAVTAKKGQKITTQWILPNGHRLAAVARPRAALVEAQVKDLTGKRLPKGRWRCVLRVGKTVLATLNVRLK